MTLILAQCWKLECGTTTVSSAVASDYDGTYMGGGATLTRTAPSSWSLALSGKFSNAKGVELVSVSLQTTSDFVITGGSLSRADRTISSGVLVISHNKAKFKSTLSYTNVTYENNCCYPVGGSISLSLSGATTGTGSLSFGTCGKATSVIEGKGQEITFASCE